MWKARTYKKVCEHIYSSDMEAMGMLLAQSILFNIFIKVATVDVEFEFDRTCYTEGDSPVLSAKYTGGATEQLINWFYEGKVSGDNTIDKDSCTYDIGGADPGYPAMTYNCDDRAQHIYKATITSVPKTAIGKEWGASFTLNGGISTGYTKQTLKQCTTTGGLSKGAIAGIAVGAVAGVAIVVIPVVYCFITKKACFG